MELNAEVVVMAVVTVMVYSALFFFLGRWSGRAKDIHIGLNRGLKSSGVIIVAAFLPSVVHFFVGASFVEAFAMKFPPFPLTVAILAWHLSAFVFGIYRGMKSTDKKKATA